MNKLFLMGLIPLFMFASVEALHHSCPPSGPPGIAGTPGAPGATGPVGSFFPGDFDFAEASGCTIRWLDANLFRINGGFADGTYTFAGNVWTINFTTMVNPVVLASFGNATGTTGSAIVTSRGPSTVTIQIPPGATGNLYLTAFEEICP